MAVIWVNRYDPTRGLRVPGLLHAEGALRGRARELVWEGPKVAELTGRAMYRRVFLPGVWAYRRQRRAYAYVTLRSFVTTAASGDQQNGEQDGGSHHFTFRL